MNKQYRDYLLSDEWAQIKIDLFNKRGRKCEKCLSKIKLNVHHLTYKNIYKEEPEDLIILCEKCHLKEHKLIKVKTNKKGKNKTTTKKQLSLAQKVDLKKRNPKEYKRYIKALVI